MAATAVTGSTPDSCFRPPECEALPYSVQRMCLHQTQASEQYCHPGAATLQCTSYGRRYVGPPPCMLLLQVSPECGALVSPGQSTFGKLTTGTIPSSAATLIPRAARERRVSAVSPEAQFPSGQVSSFGAKGLQRLSTSRQSARTLMKARPEVNPIQKQWTDVGPGAYSPPSTCVRDALVRLSGGSCEGAHAWWYVCGACLSFGDGKGAAAVLPKNLSGSRRAATASGRRGRRQRSGAPGRLGQTSQVSSLKDWLACVTRRCVVAVGGCDGDTSQPWWLCRQHGGSSSEGAAAGAGGGKGASGVGSGKQAQPQSLSAWLEQYGKPARGTMFQHMETRRPRLSRCVGLGGVRANAYPDCVWFGCCRAVA